MKKLVICCDGTWNRLDNSNVTNVVRMAEAVSPFSEEGAAQIVYYDEGVGSGSAVASGLDRFLGGAFGSGLMTKVEHAYRFLVFNYDPCDEIYIFGFSRGAFTARSLTGLIRNCGILEQRQARRIGEAIALYRARGPDCHPDAEKSCAFRASASPATYLNQRDLDWRKANDPAFDPQNCTRLRLRHLGVWDTVGALGVPSHFAFADWFNGGYRFHDACLSSTVESARHALALDEFRRSFEPALWSNLDTLNEAAGRARYLQQWFPGDHSSIGGGGVEEGLSSAAFVWIAEGAREAGLALEPAALDDARKQADHRGPLRSSPAKPLSLETFMRKRPREGPQLFENVAEPARDRWREPAQALHEKELYRPASLSRVAGQMPN